MFRIILNISKSYRHCLSAFAILFFVLMSSCPIKAGIKSLVVDPMEAKHPSPNQTSMLSVSYDRCADSHLTVRSLHSGQSDAVDLLPVILSLGIAFFFFCLPSHKENIHPDYGSLKIKGSIPLFLEYRRLII